jgi:hypothetical protein
MRASGETQDRVGAEQGARIDPPAFESLNRLLIGAHLQIRAQRAGHDVCAVDPHTRDDPIRLMSGSMQPARRLPMPKRSTIFFAR